MYYILKSNYREEYIIRGASSNGKAWTENINEAKLFKSETEIENWIDSEREKCFKETKNRQFANTILDDVTVIKVTIAFNNE